MTDETTRKQSRRRDRPDGKWIIEMFHDGDCPLCEREVDMLRRMDRRGRIKFTDIAAPSFDAAACGKDYETLMGEIHARLPDGRWIRGADVFRALYTAVGFGCLVRISRLPVIAQVTDLGYRLFARNRLRLTGRCNADGACSVSSGAKGPVGATDAASA